MSDCVHDTVQPGSIRPPEDSTISLDDTISIERNFNESSQHSRQRADDKQQHQQEHPLPNIVDVNDDDISLDDGNISKFSEDELMVTSPFDCNICFDPLSEPVVTQCGHLYCWPCLYRWLEPGILPHETHIFDRASSQSNNNLSGQIPPNNPPASSFPSNIDRSRRCCPVCKSPCAISTIVPIYVRHDISSKRRQTAAQTTLRQRKTSRKNNEPNDVTAAANDDDDISPTIPPRPQPHRPQPTTITSTPRSPTTPPPNNISNVMNRTMRDSSFHQSFFAALSPDTVRTPALHRPMHPEDVVHNGRPVDETAMAAAAVTGERWNSTLTGGEDATTEFLSRLLLMLGSFVIFCLLLF